MGNIKLNAVANTFCNKYKLVKEASDGSLFKDCTFLSEILEAVSGGLSEYKDWMYENETNPEIIKLYDEGIALIRASLHLTSGKIAEIDEKIERLM